MPVLPNENFDQPLFEVLASVPGLDIAVTTVDRLLTWASTNSFFVFPMATSCCGIELMATAAARVDADRMGAILRGTPRQCDVMVVAGTITVKMAPRVKKLWDMMPEPKWCIAMGSCAISGDFYRDIYSVVPGIDTFLPVDVYVPGCPPNPEHLMAGLIRLQEKIRLQRAGQWADKETRPETDKMIRPAIRRLQDEDRDPLLGAAQLAAARGIGMDGLEHREREPGPQAPSSPHAVPTELLGLYQRTAAHVHAAAHPRALEVPEAEEKAADPASGEPTAAAEEVG